MYLYWVSDGRRKRGYIYVFILSIEADGRRMRGYICIYINILGILTNNKIDDIPYQLSD